VYRLHSPGVYIVGWGVVIFYVRVVTRVRCRRKLCAVQLNLC
jgi:hypothetical protein